MTGELSRPGHERQIQRLVQTVLRARGGSVWFVVGSSTSARSEIIARLSSDVGVTHDVATVEIPAGTPHPFDRIAVTAEAAGRPHPVVIACCGRSADGLLPDSLYWQDVNVGREARRRGGWHLILWVALDGLETVRDAAPDLWSHRSGLVLALTAEDFAIGAEARAREERPGLSARIERLLATTSIDENALVRELRLASNFGGLDPSYSGNLVRMIVGNTRVAPDQVGLAIHEHAACCGGGVVSARFANVMVDGIPLPLGLTSGRVAWEGLRSWLARWQRRLPSIRVYVQSRLAIISLVAGRLDRATDVLADLRHTVEREPADERAAQLPFLQEKGAGAATLGWRTLDALEKAHDSVARFAACGDVSLLNAVSFATHQYAAIGQPTDAAALIEGTSLSSLDQLKACVRSLRAGASGLVPSTRALVATILGRHGDSDFWDIGGHPRVRADGILAAADALRVLGAPDDLERAMRLLAELHLLPSRVAFLPPLSALAALRPDADDPVERGLARLRDQVVRRTGARSLSEAFPGTPANLDIEIEAAGDLVAEAWRLEAQIRADRGEWIQALGLAARADEWYAAHDWNTSDRVGVLCEAAEILLDHDRATLAVECLERAGKQLEGERSPDVDLRPVARVVEVARHRARAAIALGAPTEALTHLDAARSTCIEAGNVEQEFEACLAIAALSGASAAWHVRAAAAQRALAAATEASLLIEEGRALVAWSALLAEAGRDDEARAARKLATWIGDRCPAAALVKALADPTPRRPAKPA